MIDRIFSAALTFCLLIAGTLAIGSAWFGLDRPAALDRAASAAPVRIVQLERVVVVGKRSAPVARVAQAGSTQPAVTRIE